MSTEGLNIKPEHKKEIPLSWFIGVGREDIGIMTVGFSLEFYKLTEEDIQKRGFTMEELNKKRAELQKEFQGKKEARFKFKLFKKEYDQVITK